MNNGESIIEKIINDSLNEVTEAKTVATAKANVLINKAQELAENKLTEAKKTLKEAYDDLIARRVTVANLEVKKILLKEKKELIDLAFIKAKDTINKLSSTDYLKIISGMIALNATDGDVIVISEKDKGKITEAFIDKIGKKLKINLSLAQEFGDFDGGILISNNKFDTDSTLETELDVLKSSSEMEIVEALFKKEAVK